MRLNANKEKNLRPKRESPSLKSALLVAKRRKFNEWLSLSLPKMMASTCKQRSMKTFTSGWKTKFINQLKNPLRSLQTIRKIVLKAVLAVPLSKVPRREQVLALTLMM